MQYQVSREGQLYGPYTLEDLRRYVASGNILLTDLAKSEDSPNWVPVAQIVGAPRSPHPLGLPAGLPHAHRQPIPRSPQPALAARHALQHLHLRHLHHRLEHPLVPVGPEGPAVEQRAHALHHLLQHRPGRHHDHLRQQRPKLRCHHAPSAAPCPRILRLPSSPVS